MLENPTFCAIKNLTVAKISPNSYPLKLPLSLIIYDCWRLSIAIFLQTFLLTLGFIISDSKIAMSQSLRYAIAQVTTDGTVNTQVTQNGNVAEITGGETQGGNLFHSFQYFSINTGNSAAFNNADNITNIFSRVTGGNISNIDGLIRANGTANLFLINPAGIIFGENASLDVGGSFYGSSANSILFNEGEFNATDINTPPTLTINAPIGLGFRAAPGDLVNRSLANNGNGLQVAPGKNLTLIGGNVNFDAGTIFSPGSNVELGGLLTTGEIGINNDGSLSFPDIARGDVSLQNGSSIIVNSGGGGNITVNARNFELQGSALFAGINSGLGSPNAQAGDININATDNVFITGQDANNTLTSISNSLLFDNSIGNAGNINIAADNIFLSNGGAISSFMAGLGNSGDITLNAQENISIDGSNNSTNSIVTNVASGEGNSGTTNITAQNLSLSNGGSIVSATRVLGNSGDINLNIQDSLTISGEAIFTETALPSKISTNIGFDPEGNPAKGNSGNINISTSRLSLSDKGLIDVSTYGIGNAGNINIDATESITLDSFFTKISSSVLSTAEGNGGNIEISTADLTLSNNATIDASTIGKGDAGNIDIDATESIALDNSSSISSTIDPPGEGDGGNIEISTGDLTLYNDASIRATTSSKGNGGEINISAINLSLINGATVIADTLGLDANNIVEGNGGNININVADIRIDGTTTINFEGEIREVSGGIYASNSGNKIGNAGNITITANKLSLANGSQINSFSRGIGNGGNITINAQDSILLDAGNELEVFTGISSGIQENGVGNAGNINITTSNLDVFNNTNVSVSSLGSGDGGNILIEADSLNLNQNSIIDAVTSFGTGGNINLEVADKLSLDNNSTISARALDNATGGNVDIQANFIVALPQGNNDIVASAQQSNGGNITINAESLLGIAKRPLNNTTNDINASSQITGLDGTINVNTAVVNPVQGVIQLPNNLVESEQTTNQACQANRETAANNALVVKGKGGIPARPDEVLTSQNLIVIGQYTDDTYITPEPRQTNQDTIQPIVIGQYTDETYLTPEPIKTSVGMIQPARGIEITSGGVVLTAYPTVGVRERTPQIKRNCG
ncbi:filamentous hemagglutinin outer membrane protein [Chondrocystis sp. NIES-4102]|nr:filamentous hemagglutinin outer membrane protein [Chondrocystis sp. NIES-4102]